MKIIKYEHRYRDDLIFMVLEAKNALNRVPTLNVDLLDLDGYYFSKGDMFWIAVDDNDRVIGSVGCNINSDYSAVLHRLYIKSNLKRQGVGTKLLDVAENFARERQCNIMKVHLGDEKTYFESRCFYPKHGYSFDDAMHMSKTL